MENIFYGLKNWQKYCVGLIILLGIFCIVYSYRHRVPNLPTSVRITIPEGFDNKEIADQFDIRFKYFDHNFFIKNAPIGYMFPDTYYVGLYSTATSTILVLKNNFSTKIAPFIEEVKNSQHNLNEIITMASILEAEVKGIQDRKIVSGILWKRLRIHMPLQVDSSPETYKHIGLPETPINNPGLDSILASLRPTDSQYLYFLTDSKGIVHYAKTFDEHKTNKAKYFQ